MNNRPYKEGIKTLYFVIGSCLGNYLNNRPYKEGIKTVGVLGNFTYLYIWITDLIKKGLRHNGYKSNCKTDFYLNNRPYKEGIKTKKIIVG